VPVNIGTGRFPSELRSLDDDGRAGLVQEAVAKLLVDEVEIGSFPGAVWMVGDRTQPIASGAIGHSVLKPAKIPLSIDTIFDVASLTKPLITAALVLRSAADGALALDQAVSGVLTELRDTDKDELTYIDLLTHRGGFQAWYPLYAHGLGGASYLEALIRRPLRYRPGTREIYSCLGFVTLTLALERIHGKPLEDIAAEQIFGPLGLQCSMFNPSPNLKYRIAATEWGNGNERQMVAERGLDFKLFRNYMIWGEVNDGNSYYMGGLAGNAGLFANARDVYEIARQWLLGGGTLLPENMTSLALRNYTVGLEENRGLGWLLHMTRPGHPSSVLSQHCYGHTGFTGTSVWVDPARDLILVLLTNRLHPYVKPLDMQSIRREFHRVVADIWD
jgi:serine-type D-Ala-D-Ala carboxypeptidase